MPETGEKDPYNLRRFVDAQDAVYERVRSELRAGYKSSHWMWFVFPQIEGLGSSHTAAEFAISSLGEAAAYLGHPILGPRLRECTRLTLDVEGRSITDILGGTDGMKFRSCMTLFAHATPDNELFEQALEKYFGGEFDRLTLERI